MISYDPSRHKLGEMALRGHQFYSDEIQFSIKTRFIDFPLR